MAWTKENNPHTKNKKVAARKTVQQFLWKGVKQFGDCRFWNEKNVGGYYRRTYVPVNEVGPGDIVDDLSPEKRYTFYLFTPTQNDDSARELDRLRRAGFIKCASPRFLSPTEKFETRDGVLVLGQAIWYALPEEKIPRDEDEAQKKAELIASAHADIAALGKAAGLEATAQTRNDLRGERTR